MLLIQKGQGVGIKLGGAARAYQSQVWSYLSVKNPHRCAHTPSEMTTNDE
jgi:hypothetical protein